MHYELLTRETLPLAAQPRIQAIGYVQSISDMEKWWLAIWKPLAR